MLYSSSHVGIASPVFDVKASSHTNPKDCQTFAAEDDVDKSSEILEERTALSCIMSVLLRYTFQTKFPVWIKLQSSSSEYYEGGE